MNRTVPNILVIDDEESICWGLQQLFASEGYRARTAASAEEGLALARESAPDLVILDVRLPGMDGLTAMRALRAAGCEAPVVIITAFGDLPTAVAAVNQGAVDYLPKPFDLEQVLAVVRRALGGRALGGRAEPPAQREAEPVRDQLIGRSVAMQEIFKRIALVAPSDSAVLITGESGVGKELVARALHANSARRDRPLYTVNLASLSPSLVESELFGHVRGAFTGADADRAGLLEVAQGATVFLDEIGEVPLPLQAKLLRVLESREFSRVGDTRTRTSDFRLISATNRPLEQAILDGAFRRDLYFRLAGFEITLPPLRERPDDIGLLAEHFMSATPHQPRAAGLTPAARDALLRRPWPGNVRELKNAINHATILARGTSIGPEHLPPPTSLAPPLAVHEAERLRAAVRDWAIQQFAGAIPSHLHERCLAEIEPPLFEVVLERTSQNRAAAAEILGIHRATLRKKLG